MSFRSASGSARHGSRRPRRPRRPRRGRRRGAGRRTAGRRRIPRAMSRLVGQRHDAGALLAGRLRDQLLEPQPERADAGSAMIVSLSRPCATLSPRSAPSLSGTLSAGPAPGPDCSSTAAARSSDGADLDACERRGHETEVREGREPPADVGAVQERPLEAALLGARRQLRAGVGDGDEARAILAGGVEEVLLHHLGLERGPRLRGDHEQRAVHRHGQHGIGIGGVQHVQPAAERLAQHQRREARAAHAAQHDAVEAAHHLGRPGLDRVSLAPHLADHRDPARPAADLGGALRVVAPEAAVAGEQLAHRVAGDQLVDAVRHLAPPSRPRPRPRGRCRACAPPPCRARRRRSGRCRWRAAVADPALPAPP